MRGKGARIGFDMAKHTSGKILGIDIGGSGIKGAPVNVETGELLAERIRVATPQPSTPQAVAEVVAEIARRFNWAGPIGCTFPAVVQHGVTLSAANVDKAWIGTHAEELFELATNCPVTVINDADAAALGEVAFGAGQGRKGLVVMLTFGTGIGSGLILDGRLIPNSELGHLELNGKEVEPWACDRTRERDELSWEKWAKRVQKYLEHLEMLFTPDLFIIGGGISKKSDKFKGLLRTKAELVIAELQNNAGIAGAAMAAHFANKGQTVEHGGLDITPEPEPQLEPKTPTKPKAKAVPSSAKTSQPRKAAPAKAAPVSLEPVPVLEPVPAAEAEVVEAVPVPAKKTAPRRKPTPAKPIAPVVEEAASTLEPVLEEAVVAETFVEIPSSEPSEPSEPSETPLEGVE
jgi:polyphosphate glucokinase